MSHKSTKPLTRRAVLGGALLTGLAVVHAAETEAATQLQGIIVTFKGPSGGWRRVRPTLKGFRYRIREVYQFTNQVALDIEPRGVAHLLRNPLVESIAPNGLSAPTLGAPQ